MTGTAAGCFRSPVCFPAGREGWRGPRGDAPPILFLGRQKENAPRPVEEKKRFGRTGETPVREYGGRANRPVRRRKPRRPCVLPRCLKDRIPAFDGGGVAVGSDLNGRISIPARSEAERAEIEAGQIRDHHPRPTTPGRYAGTQLFAEPGPAQGRRGHRSPPDRFARPPFQPNLAPAA